MTVQLLQPAGLVASPAFSHVAVIPPNCVTIHLGGQNGVDENGKVVSSDVAEQAVRAVENAELALASAGATLADVFTWNVMIVADADLGSAYRAIAPKLARNGAPPLVTSAMVAGLLVPGALIEISAVAALSPTAP